MDVDFITIEIGVEGVAVTIVHTNGLSGAVKDADLQGHDRGLVD